MATAYANEIPQFQGRAPIRAVALSEIWEPEPGSSYKDILAQSYKIPSETSDYERDITDPVLAAVARELATIKDCGNAMLRGVCEHGDEYGKVLRCGREWCPSCGRMDSEAHMRRYSRVMPKLLRMRAAGMLVVQWPVAFRVQMRDPKVLRRIATTIVRWLKRNGFERGVRAWDWFGDPRCPIHHEPGKHNRETGRYECKRGGKLHDFDLEDVLPEDMNFNPHLNIILDVSGLSETGFLENLEDLKASLRRLLKQPKLIIHYEYSNELPNILHMGRYAVKPTFHDVGWDFEMVAQLVGFRSFWAWGKWDDEPFWTLEEQPEGKKIAAVMALESGTCPECGTAITWHGVWNSRTMRGRFRMDDMGGGYWRIYGRRWEQDKRGGAEGEAAQ